MKNMKTETVNYYLSSHHDISAGFTLMEVMVAVAILGILSAIAFPNFQYTMENNRVRTSASDAHVAIMLARSEAIKRNDDVTISGITGGWQVTYGSTVLEKKDDVPTSVTLTSVCPGTCPSSLIFDRTGRPNAAMELRFVSNKNANVPLRCVSISLSGRPKIEVDTDSNSADGCD